METSAVLQSETTPLPKTGEFASPRMPFRLFAIKIGRAHV